MARSWEPGSWELLATSPWHGVGKLDVDHNDNNNNDDHDDDDDDSGHGARNLEVGSY